MKKPCHIFIISNIETPYFNRFVENDEWAKQPCKITVCFVFISFLFQMYGQYYLTKLLNIINLKTSFDKTLIIKRPPVRKNGGNRFAFFV